MLSWIFRHRRRLRVIYGVGEIPALPGRRFAAGGPTEGDLARSGRPRPGEVRVLSRHVVVQPMPPRVAS
jgi:hypothetical protein